MDKHERKEAVEFKHNQGEYCEYEGLDDRIWAIVEAEQKQQESNEPALRQEGDTQ